MTSDRSCVDKYITWALHAQKGWLLNIWASAGCCKLCLGWLAIPLFSRLFQLSELLAYAKNTCQFDHLYARYRVKVLSFHGWGRVENGDALNSFVSLGACTIK